MISKIQLHYRKLLNRSPQFGFCFLLPANRLRHIIHHSLVLFPSSIARKRIFHSKMHLKTSKRHRHFLRWLQLICSPYSIDLICIYLYCKYVIFFSLLKIFLQFFFMLNFIKKSCFLVLIPQKQTSLVVFFQKNTFLSFFLYICFLIMYKSVMW